MHNGTEIVFDSANGHRLRLLNIRANDMALYEDLEDGSRVLCSPKACDEFPRKVEPFQRIEMPDKKDWKFNWKPVTEISEGALFSLHSMVREAQPDARRENAERAERMTNFLMNKFAKS